MIDEKKLLCAFIYSAYDSGYCGLMLEREKREEHKRLYMSYIRDKKYYPKKEIEETQEKIMSSVNLNGTRDYIYFGHFDVVKSRIEEQVGSFDEAIKSPIILNTALNCPTNLYKVIEVNGHEIMGGNIVLFDVRSLRVLDGLEIPKVGDMVSGHWGYLLEVVDLDLVNRYLKFSRDYFDKIKRSLRKVK